MTTAVTSILAGEGDLYLTLGVEVMSYQIVALNYITDMAQISVFYRK